MSRFEQGSIPFQVLEREVFRFIKDAFQSTKAAAASAAATAASEARAAEAGFSPAVDVYETPEETIVEVDLPGVDPAQVEITAEGGVLTVRGTRAGRDLGESAIGRLERPVGAFVRRIPLPREVDLDAARAEGNHGVLTIRLPRPAAQKPRTIPIQSR
mgnify:CR=1 FL=1